MVSNEPRKMSQSVKYLLSKHGDLSSDLQYLTINASDRGRGREVVIGRSLEFIGKPAYLNC